jgi:hypothetical protein
MNTKLFKQIELIPDNNNAKEYVRSKLRPCKSVYSFNGLLHMQNEIEEIKDEVKVLKEIVFSFLNYFTSLAPSDDISTPE